MGADVESHDHGPDRGRPLVLRVASRRDGPRAVVVLEGELDMDGADRLTSEVRVHLADQVERIEVDGLALAFVDSAGLRTLLSLQSEVSAAGVAFAVAASPHLTRLLQLTGLSDVLALVG
jgi:anti-anti-sigma factor